MAIIYTREGHSLAQWQLSGGETESIGDSALFGIITVSDRASKGEYEDEGGPAILGFFAEAINSPWQAHYRCVPDEIPAIKAAIIELADEVGCSVIVTTGGTGPAIRDVTPEATEAVCERILPGFGEQMRAISLKFVPTAILSRQIGGTRGKSIIFNLPGRPKAIRETIDELWRAVPYGVDLLGGPYIDCNPQICDAFRPKSARR
ncbi:MAG TPA: molybdopterin adenylyltransferase [Candidatus Poseidoniales archaeon]|jgi:molybdopterin adenylyltransferase|nr:MAG: molybdopterin adenylyltransferase [Euryarchaeota archaeon]HIF16182.1 molybdopterin adenylyltransferase [Candidatus Poseidoniales archaeon]HIK77886.1 molybdopterin adenylyltransferase [Candidatus Poseidoniales archaeon]